jgi:DNA polymerase I
VKTWKVLRKIENRGIRVFKEKVLQEKELVKKKKMDYTDQIYRLIPKKTNLNSSLQLRKIFFNDLKISPTFLTKNGNPSTDTDALRSIPHPLARLILNVRACNKTTEFMDQYLNFMVQHKDKEWYLHPTFHQSIAVTGRESCSSPNLQQVASGESDKGADIMVEARNVFGPRENYVWRSYDWKNIEVYIPAFCSGDSKLTDILRAGGDVHQNTTDSLTRRLGRSINRFQGKRTFFGLQYGIGRAKLAKTLGTDIETAIYIREAFNEEYPGLCEWMKKLNYQVIRDGYITTQYGIRKYLGQQESYKAVNYFVQGTASSILKNAKIKIYDRMREKEWKAYIVLPVHDEMIIEIRKDQDINLIDHHVVICMQDNPELKMPISIPVSISAIQNNWAEKKKIKVV